jgi:hypothetical protein
MREQIRPPNAGTARCYTISLCCFFLTTACSTIANYDQVAYDKVTGAKAEVLTLVDKATGSYSSHIKDVEAVTLTLNKAYEYDRGRPLNQKTTQLWEQLFVKKADDPNSGIYPRFIDLWKKEDVVSAKAVETEKTHLTQAFDDLIATESGKKR